MAKHIRLERGRFASKFKKKSASDREKKLIGSYGCLRGTVIFALKFWRQLLPPLILALFIKLVLGTEPTLSANLIQWVWFVFVSTALIWTIRHVGDKTIAVSLGQTYYVGTAANLRFGITLFLVALTFLPLLGGSAIFSAIGGLPALPGHWLEKTLAGLILFISAGISFVVVSRTVFSLIIVTLPDVTPTKALELSWNISRGRLAPIGGRLLVFLVVSLPTLVVINLMIPALRINVGLVGFINQALTTLLILPLGYIYLYQLYQNLNNLNRQALSSQ